MPLHATHSIDYLTRPFSVLTGFKKIAHGLVLLAVLMPLANRAAPLPTYQVEAIIFERTGNAYTGDDAWRKNPSLSYPLNYRTLKKPASFSSEDNFDSFVIERSEANYVLTAEANALRKKTGYRVLFHKAWQQTLTSPQNAPAVVITGGDQYDNYFELSGSLRISVNRYLHVTTNLWLTQFTANLGNTMDIPYLPLTPDLAFNTQNNSFSDITYTTNNSVSNTRNNNYSLNDYSNNPSYLAQGTVLNATKATEQRHYLPQRIITTTQSARMRSMELHYIDHPRIGVLIKIIPMNDSDVISQSSLLEGKNNNATLPESP